MNEFTTHKGLRIEAPDVGDIVTAMLQNDIGYRSIVFEVVAATSAAVACQVVWSDDYFFKVGKKLIFRHKETVFHEASELLLALQVD